MQAEYLYEADSFDDRFSYQMQLDGLVVLQHFADFDAPELLVEKLNPADGSLLYDVRIPLSESFWHGLLWTDDHAYLALSNLVAVDLGTGEAEVEFPQGKGL